MKSMLRLAGLRKILLETLTLALALTYFFRATTFDTDPNYKLYTSISFYFILFCDSTVAFVLGFSTSVYNRQRFNLLTMSLLRFLTSLAVIQLFNYILLKERVGLHSPQVLPLALGVTCLFSIFWRLLFFESQFYYRSYKVLSDPESLDKIKSDLASFRGKVDYASINHMQEKVIDDHHVNVIQDESLTEEELGFLIQKKMQGYSILNVMQFYEEVLRKVPVDIVSLNYFIFENGFELTSRQLVQRLKRVTDIILSITLFSITWPLVLFFGVLHKLESSGPIFYFQIRTGHNGEPFRICKLRSMRIDAEKSGAVWAQVNDPRITRIGKFIRLTRIDELPQLWNVLVGDMSFIGPRPERPEFNKNLAHKIPFYDLRHSVRPGLTGWAQVKYPYGASEEDAKEKLQYDLYYIKNYSLLLDLEILIKTIFVIFLGRGR